MKINEYTIFNLPINRFFIKFLNFEYDEHSNLKYKY